MERQRPSLANAFEIHLWLTNPATITDQALLDRYKGLLGSDELGSYSALAQAEHRREYLISQAFLRDVLSNYAGDDMQTLEFERNASGKPSLKHSSPDLPGELESLQFNLSHSAELMACCVTRAGAVGVDVEALPTDNGMLEDADNYFSSSEVASLQNLDSAEQRRIFCKIWTLKEAYIKARGEGLSLALDSFSFECAGSGEIRLHEQDAYRDDWQFWSLQPIPGQMVAIAAHAEKASLRVFSGIPLGETNELSPTTFGQVA
jgi:4'-phosphopantetheinyl transferase